jgi:hypothetical protein
MDSAHTLAERLEALWTCSTEYLEELVQSLSLESRLPINFLGGLQTQDRTICLRAIVLCYCVTQAAQIPREMQLRAVLADQHGKDALISAGTGQGKTLPTVLKILLDDPKACLTSITLSPLNRLQVTQESDFNTRYGIPTVVINEDTPSDDRWWEVGCFSKYL